MQINIQSPGLIFLRNSYLLDFFRTGNKLKRIQQNVRKYRGDGIILLQQTLQILSLITSLSGTSWHSRYTLFYALRALQSLIRRIGRNTISCKTELEVGALVKNSIRHLEQVHQKVSYSRSIFNRRIPCALKTLRFLIRNIERS